MKKKLRGGRTSLGLQLFPFCILGLPQLSLFSGWCSHLLFVFPHEVAVEVCACFGPVVEGGINCTGV